MKDKRTKAKKARAATERKRQRALAERDGRGRLHLVLHRDPASGQERLALRAPVFKEDWQNEITTGAANTAHALLRDGPTVERAVALGQAAMAATSRLTDALFAQAPDGALACRAGCDHCCHQVVGVTVPEALAIVEHLRRTLSEAELAELRARTVTLFEQTRGQSSAQRFSPAHPCVFLRDRSCSIYEARPLSCRGMNSLDAEECRARLRDPDARASFLATGRGGHAFMEPIRGAQAVSAGLQLGVSELYQLDMRPLDLLRAMHLLLGDDGTLANEWLSGRKPFDAAVCEANDLGLRELAGALMPTTPG